MRELELNVMDLRFHVLAEGDVERPLVLLLHGFPELCESWRDVMPRLAEAGLYAIAPDLRGYGKTDKPRGGYDLDSLTRDMRGLIATLGRDRVHVVGHDWGGAIAYHLAAHYPEVVDRLAVVNCPPPPVMVRRVWQPQQLFRSLYVLLLQVPGLPERLLSARGGVLVPELIQMGTHRRRHLTRERLRVYAESFADRRAAKAAVSYYRELARAMARGAFWKYPVIGAPFRLIWGEKDPALSRTLTYGLEPYFSHPIEVKYLPDVGHFVPLEAPETLAALLVEHLVPLHLLELEEEPELQAPVSGL